MSEEQSEGLQTDQVNDQDEQQQDKQSEEQPSYQDEQEAIARKSGWKPEDEFEGDKSQWKSAEVFNVNGEWIQKVKAQNKRIDDIENGFNKRLENAAKLHEIQLKTQKAELVRKRDEAIDLADRETANSYQNDIDSLNIQPAQEPVNDSSVLDQWNAANPWIMGTDPKAAYAVSRFNAYSGSGMSHTQAIAAMEADVGKAFPNVNPNRSNQPLTEGGTKPGRKAAAKKLSMSDLTSEERKYQAAMPGAWASEAEFLQAVQDSRSAK